MKAHYRLLPTLGALLLAACGGQNEGGNGSAGNQTAGNGSVTASAAKGTLFDTLSRSNDHATLANAVKAAGLAETLSGSQPYTLFAPTDAAFGKLPPGSANSLLEPEAKPQLVALLTAHIVPGVVTAAELRRAIERGKGKAQLATVGGSNLIFARSGDAVVVTDAKGDKGRIGESEMLQSNGVIHSIDTVLVAR